MLGGALARCRCQRPEANLGRREGVGLQRCGLTIGVVADEHELAVGGDQHLTILLEVAQHLFALGHGVHVGTHRLHLESAAGWQLPGQGLALALLELACDEEAAVGDAGAAVGGLDHAAHLGLQLVADLVEERGEGAIAGGLGN